MKFIFTLLSIALLPFLNSCVPYDDANSIYGGQGYLDGFNRQQSPSSNGSAARPQGYWDGDDVQGPAKIRISINDQKAYFYKGDTLVGVSPISTGTDGHSTPKGSFKITQKSADHSSSLYGIIKDKYTGETIIDDADTRLHKPKANEVFVHAPMPHFMRFNGAIGMHAGFLPGYPASHGCVRMLPHMAEKFFANVERGTPVIVE